MKLFAIAYILLAVWVIILLVRVEDLEEKVRELTSQLRHQGLRNHD